MPCTLTAGTTQQTFIVQPGSPPQDFVLNAAVSIAVATTATVTCGTTYYMDPSTVYDLSWSGGELSAIEVD